MTKEMQTSPYPQRLDHLYQLISSSRFLGKEGLGNEVPFFIIPFRPSELIEMDKLRGQLTRRLDQQGIRILDINLYDLSYEILAREGDWNYLKDNEQSIGKQKLLEELQGILDSESTLIPEMAGKMAAQEHSVLFISGVGEVFPYVRSHNVLNNLQKVAKQKPTVLFFPGEYTHSLSTGASLDLFGPTVRLESDKYYRAFNIFDRDI